MRALLSDELDSARSLAEETRRRFVDLGDWYGQGTADFVIYEIERRRGNWDEAVRLMLDEIDRAVEKRDVLMLASVFETMGNIEINRGRPQRGLVLAGASSALKESAGGGAPPALVVVPDARELVAGSLSDEEIAELFDEGRALTLDEAIAFLRKDPDSA
jgi:hypothetical protein